MKEASNEAQIEIAKIAAEKEAEYQQSAAKACLLILAAFVVVVVVVVVRKSVMSCISFSPLQLSGGTDQAALELESEKNKELANIRTLATVRRVSEASRFHLVNGAEPTCLPFPGEQAKGRGHAHRIRYRG